MMGEAEPSQAQNNTLVEEAARTTRPSSEAVNVLQGGKEGGTWKICASGQDVIEASVCGIQKQSIPWVGDSCLLKADLRDEERELGTITISPPFTLGSRSQEEEILGELSLVTAYKNTQHCQSKSLSQ